MQAAARRAPAHLHQKAHAFAAQLADTVRPRLLDKDEAFRFFRQLLNYAPHKADGAALKYDTHLDFFVADSAVECHRDHLHVDDYRVKVLTMKEPPARTFAHMLAGSATASPSPFIACLEWQRLSERHDAARPARAPAALLQQAGLARQLPQSARRRPEEMLVDDSATATVAELGQSLTEMEVHGHVFGACSLSIVALRPRRRAARPQRRGMREGLCRGTTEPSSRRVTTS